MRTELPTNVWVGEKERQVSAREARAIADDFLIMKVGDLLGAEEPRLAPDGRWVMSITLSNASQGMLGEVGTIAVDAASGEVLFPEEERAKAEERAWQLSGGSPP